ncbi:hypothetical protein BC832DRAFT_556145 [Gaertneriomyces semiglobifer]|nr:hypothetical protein BC832DRAFT_556145 [Gaertneriomyces semiglobifer]
MEALDSKQEGQQPVGPSLGDDASSPAQRQGSAQRQQQQQHGSGMSHQQQQSPPETSPSYEIYAGPEHNSHRSKVAGSQHAPFGHLPPPPPPPSHPFHTYPSYHYQYQYPPYHPYHQQYAPYPPSATAQPSPARSASPAHPPPESHAKLPYVSHYQGPYTLPTPIPSPGIYPQELLDGQMLGRMEMGAWHGMAPAYEHRPDYEFGPCADGRSGRQNEVDERQSIARAEDIHLSRLQHVQPAENEEDAGTTTDINSQSSPRNRCEQASEHSEASQEPMPQWHAVARAVDCQSDQRYQHRRRQDSWGHVNHDLPRPNQHVNGVKEEDLSRTDPQCHEMSNSPPEPSDQWTQSDQHGDRSGRAEYAYNSQTGQVHSQYPQSAPRQNRSSTEHGANPHAAEGEYDQRRPQFHDAAGYALAGHTGEPQEQSATERESHAAYQQSMSSDSPRQPSVMPHPRMPHHYPSSYSVHPEWSQGPPHPADSMQSSYYSPYPYYGQPYSPSLADSYDPSGGPLEHGLPRQRQVVLHRCPTPYCSKAYKNTNGLKYHLEKGRCEMEWQSYDNEVRQHYAHPYMYDQEGHVVVAPPRRGIPPEEAELRMANIRIAMRPYWCKMPFCGKRYKNLNGLKYHARTTHPDIPFEEVKGLARVP